MDAKTERGLSTRESLLDTAEALFARNGYDATSIEQILSASELSRGAVYYHFKNKESIFTAVLERVEAGVARRIATAASAAPNPLDALRVGCREWIALAAEPVVRRIVLIDAPAVVGWQAWRAIEDRNALGLLKTALSAAATAHRIPPSLVDTYAHVLIAALVELSLLVARDSSDDVVERAERTAETLVSRLLGFEPGAPWSGARAPS